MVTYISVSNIVSLVLDKFIFFAVIIAKIGIVQVLYSNSYMVMLTVLSQLGRVVVKLEIIPDSHLFYLFSFFVPFLGRHYFSYLTRVK